MTGSHNPIDSFVVAQPASSSSYGFRQRVDGPADHALASWFSKLAPASQALFQSAFAACQAKGKAKFTLTECNLNLAFHAIPSAEGLPQAVVFPTELEARTRLLKRLARSLSSSKQAIKAIPFPCCYQDEKLKYMGCNQAFESFHNVKETDIIGKTTEEVFSIAGAHETKTNRQVQQTTQPVQYETVIIDKKSALREVEIHKSPFSESSESAPGLITFYFDKTEQNRTDRQLRLAREALDHALDAFLLIDRRNGHILDMNERAISLLGHSRRELLEIDSDAIMPQLSGNQFRKHLAAISEKPNGHSVLQTLIMCKGGNVFDAEIQLQLVQRGENDQIVAIVKDVTQRVQAEAELKRLNRTLKILGSINRIIINAPDEDTLIAGACDKIAQEGEYSSVCIIARSPRNPLVSTVHRDSGCDSSLLACLKDFGVAGASLNRLLSLEIPRDEIRRAKPRMIVSESGLPTWSLPKFSSFIVLPLAKGGTTEGYILLFSKDDAAFDDEEVKLLRELANETTYGIASLRQEQARKEAERNIAQRLRIETAISQFSTKLLASNDLDSGLKQALPHLLSASDARNVFLYEISNDNENESAATLHCSFNKPGQKSEVPRSIPLGANLSRWIEDFEQRVPVDKRHAELLPEELECFPLAEHSRILVFPLHSGQKWIGFTGFILSEESAAWKSGAKKMMQIAAQLIGELYGRHHADKHQKMLMAAINNSDEGVLISAPGENYLASRILFVNDGLCRMTGYKADKMIGESASFLQPANRAKDDKLLESLANGKGYTGQANYAKEDGANFIAERSVYPIFDSQGKLMNYLSIQRDITEKKQLQSRLEFANKMESVGQLSAGIAHEINTPSQFIGDNLRFIKDAWKSFEPLLAASVDPGQPPQSEPLPPKKLQRLLRIVPEAINDACEGVERITTIVKAMREFSHPEKNFSLGDINKCISTTVTVARNEWKYVSELEMDLADSLPLVEMMPGEINQVILNIIVNSAHAIEDQNKKTGKAMGRIRISTTLVDGYVRASIADTGGGIPDEIKERIFDPFFTTKEVGKGTGQGLFMAHSIIEKKHKGRLACESLPGQGTTFHFDLPIPSESEHELN